MGLGSTKQIHRAKPSTKMIRWAIIAGFAFMLGNIFWPYIGEPKLFYVPLATMILLLFIEIKSHYKKDKSRLPIFIDFFVLLAWGNLVKQLFYSDNPQVYVVRYWMPLMSLLNDYIWGLVNIIYLIYNLLKWANRNQRGFKNSG
jgi:hypothetical protein